MGETLQPQEANLFEIRPTAAQATEQYADIALTGLFNAHANQISSERNAIWQRYTAMLIGNSILLGFTGGAATPPLRTFTGALFGMVLCALWYGMTVSGWRVFRMRVELALRFAWTHLGDRANPFAITTEYEAGRYVGWLYRFALLVILLFGLLHMVVLGNNLWPFL